MDSLTISCAADTLTFPTGSEQVHWSVIGDQISEEGGATLLYILWQTVSKSTEGSIWQLVREQKF